MSQLNEVTALIYTVGREDLRRDADQLQEYVKLIVEDNWIDTLDALRSLSPQQWASLKLPLRLEQSMKQRLAESSTAAQQAAGEDQAAIVEFTAVDRKRRRPNPALPSFETAFDALVAQLRQTDPAALPPLLRTLTGLVGGILDAPTDARKRRIRKANARFHDAVFRHPHAAHVVKSLGFVDSACGEFVEMPVAFVPLLKAAHAAIASEGGDPPQSSSAKSASQKSETKKFDPFSAHLISTNGQQSKLHADSTAQADRAASSSVRQQVAELKHQREFGSVDQVPLRPRIVTKSMEAAAMQESDAEPPDLITEGHIESVKNLMAAPKFKSRMAAELHTLKQTSVLTDDWVIRVKFPGEDAPLLELHFTPRTKISHVKQQVARFLLAEHQTDFQLFVAPPYRVLEAANTLFQSKLSPLAQVHFEPAAPHSKDSRVVYLDPAALDAYTAD
eukprot:Selendium_serpulae@DN4949_c1_g1_i1.p1